MGVGFAVLVGMFRFGRWRRSIRNCVRGRFRRYDRGCSAVRGSDRARVRALQFRSAGGVSKGIPTMIFATVAVSVHMAVATGLIPGMPVFAMPVFAMPALAMPALGMPVKARWNPTRA